MDIFQLDPELDTFSFAHYAQLEDAQAEGLRHYREYLVHRGEILEGAGATVGDLAYVQQPQTSADPSRPDLWQIVNSREPHRTITMCQIVRYYVIPAVDYSNDGPS